MNNSSSLAKVTIKLPASVLTEFDSSWTCGTSTLET